MPGSWLTEVTELHADAHSVVNEWDRLADETDASPFLRPGWFEAWWGAFGWGRCEIVTVRRNGELEALAPLQRARGGLRSPTNWHTPLFGFLAKDEAAFRDVVRAVFSNRTPYLGLFFLDATDAHAILEQVSSESDDYRWVRRTLTRSPYVMIEGTWDAYHRQLSKNLKKHLRRGRNRADEQGRVSFEVRDGKDQLPDLLDEGFRVEAAGWKGEAGTAIKSRSDTRHFYTELASWAAERDWLRLAFLRLEDRPVAFNYCLEQGGIHYLLKSGYDPEFERVSPGALLREHMVRRAFDVGIRVYELLGDADPHKRPWATGERERLLVQAFPSSPQGLIRWGASATWEQVRPLARQAWHLGRDRTRHR